MKRKFKKVLIFAFFATATVFVHAQTPPHPNGGSSPGAGNGPVGGGAAIESGLSILLAMGATYGFRKYYQKRNAIQIAE